MARKSLEACTTSSGAVSAEVVEAANRLARRRPHEDEVHAFLRAYRSMWTYLLNGRRFDALLRSVEAPTLVIRGSRDRLVPEIVGDRLARVRPDWTHVRFANAGHMPQLDEPSRFAKTVNGWSAGLEERRRAAG